MGTHIISLWDDAVEVMLNMKHLHSAAQELLYLQ